ncbi:MAG: histidine kinase dimerization/phospho-acceptor domain-containing protein, partial [Syntrophomonadaceae bacterium]|nr:histidine kinase dimerization/phospho-acceptor domain-containing protein [Syntrophomonadaceae bacterium]
MNIAILLVDLNSLNIVNANAAAQELSAYSLEELQQLSILDLSARRPDKARQLLEKHISILSEKDSSVFKDFGKTKNGDKGVVAVYLNIVTLDSMPGEQKDILQALIFDISEQVKYLQENAERNRYEAQALKMATLSAMSAGVVHEISQPLNAIKVLADGMIYWQETGRDINLAEAFTAFRNISTQAERISSIISHMRNLANASADAEYYPCSINEAVSATINLLGRQIASHGIKLTLDLDKKLPLVLAQEQRLEEIMINLMINAMQSLDESVQPEKLIVCSTCHENNKAILELANNGPCIKPEFAQNIWEPFFSTRKGGNGMG